MMLKRGLPVEPAFDYRDDSALKSHPDYRAAKAGDRDAAVRLVRDLVPARHYVTNSEIEALRRNKKESH